MMVFRFIELSISISVVVGVILLPAAGQAPVQTGKTYTAYAKRPTNPAAAIPFARYIYRHHEPYWYRI